MSASPVPVHRAVFEGIEAVRVSGLTNMLARDAVAQLCEAMGFRESALWVLENRGLYAQAVFHGFEVIDEPGGEAAPTKD